MLADFDLTGRRAVASGTRRGISKGIALALAEAAASYVTGQSMAIDGGRTLL
jgi:hypothetical protein